VYVNEVQIPASVTNFAGTGVAQVVSVPFTIPLCVVPTKIWFLLVILSGGTAGFGNVVPATSATINGSIGNC
jgi:hypothetical protein